MFADYLITELFAFLLVFARLGAAFMTLPGFGEVYISMRVRLLFSLMIALVVTPIISTLPALPTTAFGLTTLVLTEVMIGVFIGIITRFLITATQIAGGIIAYQSSLAMALIPDIATGQQDTSVSNLLSFSVVLLIFVTNLHHMLIAGLVESYQVFIPGQFPPVADMANMAGQTLNKSFRIGAQLAGPHIFLGLTVYLVMGVISRLMPSMQIFFIILPAQILIGITALALVVGTIMLWYLDYFKESIGAFLFL